MKTWFNLLTICVLAVGLGACGKKSNKSSTIATTPTLTANSCLNLVYMPPSQQYPNGAYVDAAGNVRTDCQGYGNTGALPGQQWQWNQGQWQMQNGCDSYQYTYGVQYFPTQIGGQLVCVRADLMYQYAGGYQQQIPWQQQGYYMCSWNDPMCNGGYYGGGYNNHYYGGGYGNGGCLNFGGSSFQQTYGISGQLGFCW